MYLEKINSPKDIKGLDVEQLNALAGEIRKVLLEKLSAFGGHVGPNLGIVEATLALHYVFDSPQDKIVFDVSHQCDTHKILTGRKEYFTDPSKYAGISEYTSQHESPHDFFMVGHTSTSVSLACGLAKARDLQGGKGNVIALIGDGSLSGGEAYEGLSNVAEMGTNFIVVANDNEMSIAEDHGGLYGNLKLLRETKGEAQCNYFRSLGLDYIYVEDGNDVAKLIDVFQRVKNIGHPIVVHIHTLKGKGYVPAERYKEHFHFSAPFDLATGKEKSACTVPDYGELTAQFLLRKMREDPRVVAISSGTPAVIGFTPEMRAEVGKQFVDVGIAEEHAVALASGIAAGGGRPVYGVVSSFLQRTYDQLSQDLCLNNYPAVICVFYGTMNGMNDVTHLGFFDMALVSSIPNLVALAPTCAEEYFAMLEWGMKQTQHPVIIRVPGVMPTHRPEKFDEDYSALNKYAVTKQGGEVAVLALGSFYGLGEEVVASLRMRLGVDATLVNPRFFSGLDEDLLTRLAGNHRLVVTLEDGVLDGGFGEKIARFYGDTGMKVLTYGLPKKFVDLYDAAALRKECRLTDVQIVEDVKKSLGR